MSIINTKIQGIWGAIPWIGKNSFEGFLGQTELDVKLPEVLLTTHALINNHLTFSKILFNKSLYYDVVKSNEVYLYLNTNIKEGKRKKCCF